MTVTKATNTKRKNRKSKANGEFRHPHLNVAGKTHRSVAAIPNLQRICDQELAGKCRVKLIDLVKHPRLAAGEPIVAVPSLVRHLPLPLKRLIGNLANTRSVVVGLDLLPERILS
ncbi:MAG: circadian clock KaiB family protein [Candidatus Sulfotelmatobacter sp.]